MIITLILNVFVMFVGSVFSFLPAVTVLPTIGGYDIDTALVTGVGQLRLIMQSFWWLEVVFQGFLFLMGYYAVKLIVKFFFGHRVQ